MVTIGIDAHKSSLAVCLVDELGRELAAREFGNHPRAHRALHAWAARLAPGERRFGVESTGWVGRGIACFLLERGEAVVDVRGSLTERQRKRLRGQGKSDPRDALAIARITAREEQLPPVRVDSPSRDLKLLCDYRAQLLAERIRTANRLHADLVSVRPGYERQVRTLGSSVRLERAERLLAGDQRVQALLARRRIETLRRLDAEIKQAERDLRERVRESGTELPRLTGVGDLIAARIIGEVGDVARIASKSRFRTAQRHRPDPRLHSSREPSPPQPGRQPAPQPRDPHDRAHAGAHRPAGARLHRTSPQRRQNQTRRRARAQAPPLRRGLPTAPRRRRPPSRRDPTHDVNALT
jgi:transposase